MYTRSVHTYQTGYERFFCKLSILCHIFTRTFIAKTRKNVMIFKKTEKDKMYI